MFWNLPEVLPFQIGDLPDRHLLVDLSMIF
jgi:hypothetical protein